MKRRGFLIWSGAAAVQAMGWRPVRAQSSMPVVGYLHIGAPGPFTRFLDAFKTGLKDGGYVEGENLKIEYASAEGQTDRLPGLAADLVRRGVSVIATGGAERPLLAARDATKTIPIVFVVGADPVQLGVVSNVARPT